MTFETDILSVFDKKWALLTAGNKGSFNTMTVSWGGMGTIWGKPVATVYVRTSRYTHEFMDREDYFTVSFFPEEYKKVLGVLGSKSGRDMDKMNESGLTAKELKQSVTFDEAEVTLVCKKLFMQRLEPANIIDPNSAKFYEGDAPHDMYIGEIVDIIRKPQKASEQGDELFMEEP
ncbi:MAG: flavin reductase [Lachnospiraceae bacterium]|nr:flavin reductase [Lachnospiraceae bacterium]